MSRVQGRGQSSGDVRHHFGKLGPLIGIRRTVPYLGEAMQQSR
ncbi:MAG: hypothetical protein WAV02_03180 [Stellaceae bacterium]